MKKFTTVAQTEEEVAQERVLMQSALGLEIDKKKSRNKKIALFTLGGVVLIGGAVLAVKYNVKPQEIVEVVSEELGE